MVAAGLIAGLANPRPTPWRRQWIWFGALTLGMSILEEVLSYVAGTGMWESRT
jgi:hypothetical protein